MNKSMLDSGLYLIAQADDGFKTEALDKAIDQLQSIKHVRLNVPF
jgi:hypothetical protein